MVIAPGQTLTAGVAVVPCGFSSEAIAKACGCRPAGRRRRGRRRKRREPAGDVGDRRPVGPGGLARCRIRRFLSDHRLVSGHSAGVASPDEVRYSRG